MGQPMLLNWLRWLLSTLSNSLGLPTYLPTYDLTNLPTQPHISQLPSYIPTYFLFPIFNPTSLPTYLLFSHTIIHTYLPTSYFSPTIVHTYLPTYLPTSCTSHLPSYILMYAPTSYLPTLLPTMHHATY
jgi:hypothetical protein